MARIVIDYLEESARLFPEKIAIVDSKHTLTYSKLQSEAKHIAMGLIKRKVYKAPVAVFLDKSVECVSAFMGVAYSGNFYTVIDTKMPVARIERIISTLAPGVILTDTKHQKAASAFAGASEVICLEETRDNLIDDEAIQSTIDKIIDTDVLYVLFTSGSTGVPKGAIIGHRSVIDYIDWAARTFHFDHGQVFGNQAPFYFDNSVLDIYSTLKSGGTMYIIPQTCFSFPITLLQYIHDNNINTIFFVPTVLCRLADMGLLDKCDVSCLKNILFAGEVMPAKQLNIWRRSLPHALYANLYGPTEITVDCTYYIVDREIGNDEPIPIGIPCVNSDILVLNEKDELATKEEQGELCVRGTSLAYGYYNNPEKTAEAFVQNPLNPSYPEKIYRTGDIVHYNSRGELIYDGRKDSQVKHSGHRVELGEIETVASSLDGIELCCCLHDAKQDRLILFYCGALAPDEIRRQLIQLLPDYMLPNASVRLATMPLNMNGKIDRLLLKNKANHF